MKAKPSLHIDWIFSYSSLKSLKRRKLDFFRFLVVFQEMSLASYFKSKASAYQLCGNILGMVPFCSNMTEHQCTKHWAAIIATWLILLPSSMHKKQHCRCFSYYICLRSNLVFPLHHAETATGCTFRNIPFIYFFKLIRALLVYKNKEHQTRNAESRCLSTGEPSHLVLAIFNFFHFLVCRLLLPWICFLLQYDCYCWHNWCW